MFRAWLLFVSLIPLSAARADLPVWFEPAPRAGFLVRVADGGHYLTASGDLQLAPGLEMAVEGHAPTHARPEARLPGLSNDLRGAASRWRTGIPQYGAVRYPAVYPHIDLVYHVARSTVEFDFELSAGASPDSIVLAFPGARLVEIGGSGELIVRAAGRDFRLRAPRILQAGRAIAGGYRIKGLNRAGFRLDSYDPSLPLLIDPVLDLITGFGGMYSSIASIATDSTGNVYVAGTTQSQIPALNAADPNPSSANCSVEPAKTFQQCSTVFAAKFDPTGANLLYATYLGDLNDTAGGIAVDSAGNAYIAGTAYAAGPGKSGDQAWVRKLSPSGSSVLYHQVIGANTAANAIAVDAHGNALLAGDSLSLSFPAVNALESAAPYRALFAGSGSTWNILGGLHAQSVPSLAVDPANPSILYAGTSSGLFQSTDAGAAWKQLLPDAQSVSEVTLNPQSPSTVYAVYTGSSGSQAARSTDGGATWQVLTAGIPVPPQETVHSWGALALDPENPSTLWLADASEGGAGIYRSTDGGATWTDVHQFPAFFIGDSFSGTQILVDPGNSAQVFACCVYRLGSTASAIYRTGDGGQTWVEGGQGPTAGSSGIGSLVLRNGVLYAVWYDGVVSSADEGQTWTNVALPAGAPTAGFTSLGLEPSGALLLVNANGALYRSPDGGASWTASSGPWTTNATILAISGATIYIGSTPVVPPQVEHAFAARLDPAGTILWATLLSGSQQEEALAIAADASGNACIAGWTSSPDFPAANPFQGAFGTKLYAGASDAFLARISADGTKLLSSTFFGGAGADKALALALDSAGNIYLAGATNGTGLPMVNAIQPVTADSYGSSFTAEFDPAARNLLFSTYLRGAGGYPFNDAAHAIAVDAAGAVWLAGQTGTLGFPLVDPVQLSLPYSIASYVTQLVPSGKGFSIGFSTYLGGNADGILSLALAKGAVWLAGSAGASLLVPDSGLGIGFFARLDLAPPPATPGVPLIRTVSNAASFDPGDVISPGELVTLIGAEFSATAASAQGSPLPLTLAGTSVTVGGISAPLLYVSPTQINFQVPYNIPQSDVAIVVERGSQPGASRTVSVNAVTPGIFLNGNYTAPLVAHASDYSLVTPQNPAHAGEYLVVFCAGLGITNPAIPSGTAAAGPTPTVGNTVLESDSSSVSLYSGLAPGYPGLYQVNFQLSATETPGAHAISLYTAGYSSGQVLIYVQ